MKQLFKGLLILAALLVLFLVVGMMLPEKLQVERHIIIQAPAAQVYPYVSDFHLFNEWSPWAKIDPDIQFRYEGAERGQGAIVHWRSEHARVGRGSQKITAAIPNESMKSILAIDGLGKAYSGFRLQDKQGATEVIWSFDVGFGYNIPGRIMGLLMEDELGTYYERGLINLREKVEAGSVR